MIQYNESNTSELTIAEVRYIARMYINKNQAICNLYTVDQAHYIAIQLSSIEEFGSLETSLERQILYILLEKYNWSNLPAQLTKENFQYIFRELAILIRKRKVMYRRRFKHLAGWLEAWLED